jgi:hypothetical protein
MHDGEGVKEFKKEGWLKWESSSEERESKNQ